jgi:predicted RNA-binding Zn ribbon-like protein
VTRQQIRELVHLAIAASEGAPVQEAAAHLLSRLPRCEAPGCGVVLLARQVWCSSTCQVRAPRDRHAERLRVKASAPLPTFELQKAGQPL